MKALLLSLLVIALASCGEEKPQDERPPLNLDEASDPATSDSNTNPKPPRTRTDKPDNPEDEPKPESGTEPKPNTPTTPETGGTTDPVIEPRPEDDPAAGGGTEGTDPQPTDGNDPAPVPGDNPEKKSLTSFGSRAKFDQYVAKLRAEHEALPDAGSSTGTPQRAQPAAGNPNDITNNQEAGVDEGGIVKISGDYLISLLRGRLSSIRLQANQGAGLQLVDTENVNPINYGNTVWYDELLIHENKIIVVGYNVGEVATEIGEFSLANDGTIAHVRTTYLRSFDYYSRDNYTSRLIGSKLVFYMPYKFFQPWNATQPVRFPGQKTLNADGSTSAWVDIISPENLIKPIDDTNYPVLHTIVSCDLNAADLACTAKGVVGPSSSTFYVSPSAVYLWTAKAAGATVYRLPLDGAAAGAVLTKGLPVDQFSFKEADNKTLHVLLREQGGDGVWGPEARAGGVSVLNLPLGQFSHEPIIASESSYVALPVVEGYALKNRYVGNKVVYGGDLAHGTAATTRNPLHVHDLASGTTKTIQLEHNVERIEALGNNAIAIGPQGENLIFTSVSLGNEVQKIDSYILEKAAQGEHRSHGYFYKPHSDTTGVVGLPVRRGPTQGGRPELFEESAKVIYLWADKGQFSPLGELNSLETTNNDGCVFSCADWYGNSRPIFWKDRVFALLGYELVEGSIVDKAIKEIGRLNFKPSAPAAGGN